MIDTFLSRLPRPASEDGFTLLEVLMAAVVLIVGLTTLFGLLDSSLQATASTRAREGASNLARRILEDARTIPYAQLSPAAITGQLQAMNGLADASGAAGWQVVQRGVTYTVTVSECSIDDPKDGYGVHDSSFCADSNKTGTEAEDPQPADMKRVTVDVKWTAIGRSPDVHQVLTLTAAGESVGLSASNLQLVKPEVKPATAPLIKTEPANKELTFSVSSPTGTAAVVWSLEGSRQTPAAAFEKCTTWTFSWTIGGLSDGTYKVSAQAINAAGVTGPPISIAVTLIRGKPAAPTGIRGGFNTVNVSGTPTRVAELEWQPNPERNVIGYRVYSPSGRLVCPESSATLSPTVECIDFKSPEPTASEAERTYKIVALYREPEGEFLSKNVSEGPSASFTLTGEPPALSVPEEPVGPLDAVREGEVVKLTWSAPASTPAFYRIYRGSTDYTNRYAVTGSGETTTYEDTHAVGAQSYWVTAVNSSLRESSFLGPVNVP
jgi:type II secretory pathway pseudopilin PulG